MRGAVHVPAYAKGIVAAVLAIATVLTTAITDGQISPDEIVPIALSLLTALGVVVVPNAPTPRQVEQTEQIVQRLLDLRRRDTL